MERQEYERKLFTDIVNAIIAHGGAKLLSAVILTGSFGRGEATYSLDENGALTLKSDVEIALVYPRTTRKSDVQKLTHQIRAQFEEELNLMCMDESRLRNGYNFNHSLVPPRYITIFTYDLYHGSKTIWGKDYLSRGRWLFSRLDLYEAKRLIANRIGEMIYLQNQLTDVYTLNQWRAKVVLALGSAWLICNGMYVSPYAKQFEQLKDIWQQLDESFGAGFFRTYEQSFLFLRRDGLAPCLSDLELRGYVAAADRYMQTFGICRARVNSLSRIVKYVIKYLPTGVKYGFVNFEDRILQSLITQYHEGDENVTNTSHVWHSVLY